jgi:arabinoxylan arabinofuranohydrolase
MKYLFARLLPAMAFLVLAVDVSTQNPVIRNIYTADPSAHVWKDGRLYVYPSHDVDPPRGCDLMDKYHVFSTNDMVHWRDEGQILEASQIDWGRKEGGFMWAPDAAYKNGTYYFYFPHPSGTDWNDTWKIGVATSKQPTKNFEPKGYLDLGGDNPHSMIDPCVFVDDDDKAYFYYGGGGRCMGGPLKNNMTELSAPLKSMDGLKDFHEATWVFKRKGIYYLTYADNHAENGKGANRLNYATATSPLGPWVYGGVYLDPQIAIPIMVRWWNIRASGISSIITVSYPDAEISGQFA